MTSSATPVRLGPEFDAFLFAPLDEEEGGAWLSVLSVLARLDVDPWREAAALARMPKVTAHQRLASLIAALPDAPAMRLNPATIADRLVRLLPRGEPASIAARIVALRADPAPTMRGVASTILINLLLMGGMIFVQWGLASIRSPPVDPAHAVVSATVLPNALPPGHHH
jgi:hypothetical protein